MPEPIRYFMDQHVPGPVSKGLRRHGVNVLTAQEVNRCGFSDAEQLAFAASEDRVVVTFDTDYLALHQAGVQHAGIVWCQESKYGIGRLIQVLLLVHGVLDRESMRNHVEYL